MSISPKVSKEYALYQAILQLESEEECFAFFRDLCTPSEIEAMQDRWTVTCLLATGDYSYREIQEKTGVSLTTITRVARFLKQESFQGYKKIIDKIKQSHPKTNHALGHELPIE